MVLLVLLSASHLEERAPLPIVGKNSGGESYNLRCTNQYGHTAYISKKKNETYTKRKHMIMKVIQDVY